MLLTTKICSLTKELRKAQTQGDVYLDRAGVQQRTSKTVRELQATNTSTKYVHIPEGTTCTTVCQASDRAIAVDAPVAELSLLPARRGRAGEQIIDGLLALHQSHPKPRTCAFSTQHRLVCTAQHQ